MKTPKIPYRAETQCKVCGWKPAPKSRMGKNPFQVMALEQVEIKDHFDTEHEGEEATMVLVVMCSCGGPMELSESTETGPHGWKDYFRCPADGIETFTRRPK